MNQPGARDRRPLFGGPSTSYKADSVVDPESLERENDRSIDALGERVGMFKQLTSGIHDEAESHHKLLDDMGATMSGAHVGLGTAVRRFKSVFEDPRKLKMAYIVGGIVTLTLVLYFFAKHHRQA
ncbi:hypothetical protein WJX72_011867 [[Myrmecia] bisecta]|uniref:t-SNARE coiled-coil homology domain-containing protein n=1 Tax=[Myrmecia] bisecta TaxID=41462 RepID=A0AAW1PID1_9CHLO